MGTKLNQIRKVEWPTLLMLAGCYAIWGLGLWLWSSAPLLSLILAGLGVALHGSLQHEVIHGHPFKTQWLNEALVFPALSIFISYLRFKDTHLQHHFDPALTDPYDDPESNYMDPAVWVRLSPVMQGLCRINNTLAGRMVIGPVLGTISFLAQDARKMLRGAPRLWLSYALHLGGVALVLLALAWAAMPFWAYLLAVYLGTALLKIRTYLEHRAHDLPRGRTAIVEDRGPLSYLFLNNNFHVVHHCMPNAPWYDLPRLYQDRKEQFRRRNGAYVYRSYAEIFRQYLWRAKEQVPHPIWPVRRSDAD